MSVTSAMYTGVTGLLNNGEAINVIGNNIANVNTTGFKSSRTLFADMLYSKVGNNAQVGRGMIMEGVDTSFSQGSFQNTENVTDLAIQGNSFFALKDPNTSGSIKQNAALLTRSGAFHVDDNLTLVNPDGYQVVDTQGNPIVFSDNAAGISAATSALSAQLTVLQTKIATLNTDAANLVAAAAGGSTAEQTAAASIQSAVTAALNSVNSALSSPTVDGANSSLSALNSAITLFNGNSTSFTTGAAAYNTMNTDVIAAPTQTTLTTDVTTAVNALSSANGLAFGKILKIEPNGLITYLGKDGVTTNYYNISGQPGIAATTTNAASVQRLAVMTVPDPNALEKSGNSLYKPTSTSGITATGFSLANNSPNGTSEKVMSNSLEGSNVDMASEFVNLIMTQRAYSANSKTITTADQMTQEVLNLKQ